MARPMVLLPENDLATLHEEWRLGVPANKLLAKYKCNITPPTLAKLLRHYDAAESATDDKVAKVIQDSLFPAWLVEQRSEADKAGLDDFQAFYQPNEYYYTGRMPLGKWVKR